MRNKITSAIVRLQELLDAKDAELDAAQGTINELQEKVDAHWEWCRHRQLKNNTDNLPLPRLEIRCINKSGDWSEWSWEYALIYRHLLGDLILVPLGLTTCSGGAGRAPIYNDMIHTPFREGVHIAHDAMTMNLPAFAICDGRIETVAMVNGKTKHQLYKP